MCNNMDDTETLRRPYQIAVLQHQNDSIILALCKLRTKGVKRSQRRTAAVISDVTWSLKYAPARYADVKHKLGHRYA
jgi:hypothetical protein